MPYGDPHTAGILNELGDEGVQSTKEYIEIIARHPLTMAGVFLRHAVNGLDERYSTPYIEHLQSGVNRIWRFIGFLIVFLALLRVIWPAGRRAMGPAHWRYPATLLLASATSIASAVEARFLLPVFVLCLMIVLTPRWMNPLSEGSGIRRYRSLAVMAVAAVVFFAIVLSIVSAATHNLYLNNPG